MSYYMGGEGRRLFGQTTPSELRDKFMMSVRMPVGVVGAITPWNFPIAIPAWKLTPGARVRQHRRAEAGRGHAAARAAVRRPAARGRAARGRRADRARLRRGGGRRARPPSRRPGHHVHRARARHRRARDEERRRRAEARPPRARRQERDHRHGRRRPRPRGRRDRLVGVRHRRPALHRGVARDRAARRLRRAAVEARRARREAEDRLAVGGRHRHRPGDQRDRGREDPLVHGDRPATRARSSSPAASASRVTASTTGRRCSPTSSPACGSRRRRSSARRPR